MRKPASRYRSVVEPARGLRRLVAAGLMVVVAGSAWGQQQIQQTGRLFDANPQIGGSRYNSIVGRPVSPLLEGNAMAAGQLGRGMSLRSVSPIPAWNAFRAPLGSGTLSNFTRDSVSTGQAYAPGGGLVPRLYFDPSRTVPTAGFLQGYYGSTPRFGVNTTGRPTPGGSAGVNPWGGTQYGAPPAPRSRLPGEPRSLYDVPPVNNALTASIFGVNRPGLPGPLSGNGATGLPKRWGTPPRVPVPTEPDQGEAAAGGPLDLRLWLDQTPEPPRAYLDVFSQGQASDLLRDTADAGRGFAPGIISPGVPVPDRAEQAAQAGANRALQPRAGALSMLPGHDVFTDMRLALELRRNPQAPWLREMSGAQAASPTLGQQRQEAAAEQTSRFLARVLTAPLTSFVGEAASPLNDALRRAEAAMELGRYREAIRHYDRAAAADPVNPLPLIGRGHALLAAGEYVSAAVSLITGLRRYPDLGSFRIDLTALMGGGEIVDIRRSDLMRRLAAREDPYLRFLLGYIEVNTGMPDAGLRDLERAASRAEPGSVIRTYTEIVRRRVKPVQRPPASRAAVPAAPPTSQPGKGRP